MTLNLLKLCVGVESIEHLQSWIDFRREERRARGETPEQCHTTRMVPTRRDELLDGGSLYWVIKGAIQVRQRLVDIRPFTDAAGIKRCDLVLEPVLHPTRPHPRRPFQGWRYLKAEDAPADLTRLDGSGDIPEAMRRELVELCLI
ncbi:DUF1489 family protein [Stappia sp. ES.058]|uniref:DUF1489 family protein n=1 Tax=Stappia sp. ES.058 TaxID=1881061 RepID=UPI00087C3EAE|nr:DUF1489 domain-containing protein [Stappia sp. ES.058]SDU20065.1 hypothetical protein SAMN05428979_2240 [Stappia sp. ES.058]